MKTLSQHNRDRAALEKAFREIRNKSGVACDGCGAEMLILEPDFRNASNPPTQWVECPKCGKRDLMVC